MKFMINFTRVSKVANFTSLRLVQYFTITLETMLTLVRFILNFTCTHAITYTNRKNESMEINLNDPWFTRIVFDQIDPVSGLILLIFREWQCGTPLISCMKE